MHRYEPGSRDINICLFSSLPFTCPLHVPSILFPLLCFLFFSFPYLFLSCLTFPSLPFVFPPLSSIPFPNLLSSPLLPLSLLGGILVSEVARSDLETEVQCWGSHSTFLIRSLKAYPQASSAASNISVGTGYQMGRWSSGRLGDRHTSPSEAHLKSSQKTA